MTAGRVDARMELMNEGGTGQVRETSEEAPERM